MRSREPAHTRLLALALVGVGLLASCSSSSGGTPTPPPPSATVTIPISPAVSGGALPSSCAGTLAGIVGPYVGGVSVSRSLASKPAGVSCEYANAGASRIVILNIGPGNAAGLAILRQGSAGDGRTVASVGGLGGQAFSISRGGVPAGMVVLTSGGQLFSLTANLPFARDEALLKTLEAKY